MSLQISSDKDYVGLLNDQTGKYDWIPKRVEKKTGNEVDLKSNLVTVKAIKEVEDMNVIGGFSSVDELIDDLEL